MYPQRVLGGVRTVRLSALLLAGALASCAVEAPVAAPSGVTLVAPSVPSGMRTLVTMPGAALVVLRVVSEAPLGGDGPAQLALGLARGTEIAPLELSSPAVSAVAWGDAAAVLGADGSLSRVGREGRPVLVAREVVTEPGVSDDGRLLAYVARDGDLAYALRVIEAGHTRTIARDVPSAGALRFSPDGRTLVFVGRSPGGVAGLHAIAIGAPAGIGTTPRCLTNCELVTGRPWGTRFVALPAGAAALRFDGDDVLYDQVRVAYRGGAL